MLKTLFIAALLMSSSLTIAQDMNENFDQSLVISHVEVTEVETTDKTAVTLPVVGGISEVAMIIDGLLAIGKKIWPIIDANRPVINTSGLVPAISVIPQFDANARNVELNQMANWSIPKVATYRISYKNIYGMELLGFSYTILFQYNGTHKENGKYITGLTVSASEVSAAWSMNFDASSELVNVANVGTSIDPVASAVIKVSYKVRGLLNEMRNSQLFYVDGRGQMKLLQ